MKHIFKISSFLILLLCSNAIFAQSIRVNIDNAIFPANIKANDKALIKIKMDSLMNAYAKLGTITDPQKKKVTDAAAANFYKLFTPNAQLMKDFEEYPNAELIDPKAYANRVFMFLTLDGVKYKVESVTLKDVVEDNKDFYVANLIVSKVMFTSLTARGEAKISTGRVLEQKFKIDIPRNDIARLRITSISNNKQEKIADDYIRYLNFSPNYAIDLGNAPLPSTFKANHPSPTALQIRSSTIAVGADFMTNIFSKANKINKSLFVGGGIRFQQQSFISDLKNFNLRVENFTATDSKGNSGKYTRLVDSLNLRENTKFSSINLPLGVSYRFIKRRKSAAIINLRLMPGFILGASNTLNEGQTGIYNGILEENVLTILEQQAFNTQKSALEDNQKLKPFDVGKQTITTGAQGDNLVKVSDFEYSRFSFGISLSPSFYYDFRDDYTTWGVMVGIDINYQMTTPFKSINSSGSSPEDLPLIRSYGYKNALPSYFSSGVSPISVGFRIGIYQKLQKQP